MCNIHFITILFLLSLAATSPPFHQQQCLLGPTLLNLSQYVKGGVGKFETPARDTLFVIFHGKNLPLPYRAPPPTHTNAHMTNEGTR